MTPAPAHGEFAAVNTRLAAGANLALLVAVAAGLTEREGFFDTDSISRHRALALATQFGHVEIARMQLGVGEDPAAIISIAFVRIQRCCTKPQRAGPKLSMTPSSAFVEDKLRSQCCSYSIEETSRLNG